MPALREHLKAKLGKEAEVRVEGTLLEVSLRSPRLSLQVDLRDLLERPARLASRLEAEYELIKTRLERAERRLLALIEELGAPELAAYARCKLFGGRAGFCLVEKHGGVYKVVSFGGRKRWLKLDIDYDGWRLFLELLDDVRELREILRRLAARKVGDAAGEVVAVLDAVKHEIVLLASKIPRPRIIPPPEDPYEDPMYVELLQLEATLARRRGKTVS